MATENEERTVDAALAGELATRHTRAEAILEALEGFGEERARGVLNWARDCRKPEAALRAWGKKRGAGHVRKEARRRGRRLALEGPLREAHQKLLAAEYLIEKGADEASAGETGYLSDEARIEAETRKLKALCAEEYPELSSEAVPALEVLTDELRAQVEFLEARLRDALEAHVRDPDDYIRKLKGLPRVPVEYDR